MFSMLGQTWRSVVSVVIAYFLVVVLFLSVGAEARQIWRARPSQ